MKKIIFTNNYCYHYDNLTDDDWKYLCENADVNIEDENAKIDYVNFEIENNYYDEIDNLKFSNSNEKENILAIANLGLWNGRVYGYKELGNNLECILEDIDYNDYGKLFSDRYDIKATIQHHDGTNYCTFRRWKDDLTDKQKENFLDKIWNNTLTKKDITRYTKSIKKEIDKIYGW